MKSCFVGWRERATLLRQLEVRAGDERLVVVLRGGLGCNTAVGHDHGIIGRSVDA